MTYLYIKQPSTDPQIQIKKLAQAQKFSRLKSLFPTIMITVGASILISVGYPILSYELTVFKNQTRRPKILSPVPKETLSEAKGLLSPVSPNNPQVLATTTSTNNSTVDYTKVQNWFNFSRPQVPSSQITHYTLSIPKLKIKEAVVTIGGDDLDQSLIHYGGTANPGEVGNSVIFGHSVLPQFYNPNNYRAIFSLIPTLDVGEEILVNFDGITYRYIVNDYYEVQPDEIDILEQRYDRKELTLVTCTPPGTYWRRGIIKAQLSSI